jgi:hypothetical protein
MKRLEFFIPGGTMIDKKNLGQLLQKIMNGLWKYLPLLMIVLIGDQGRANFEIVCITPSVKEFLWHML